MGGWNTGHNGVGHMWATHYAYWGSRSVDRFEKASEFLINCERAMMPFSVPSMVGRDSVGVFGIRYSGMRNIGGKIIGCFVVSLQQTARVLIWDFQR